MSRHHKLKAAIGIFLGLAIAAGAAAGSYYDWKPDEWSEYGLLMILALPFAIWGCTHLARARGYPSDIAYVLFFLTVVAGAAIAYSKVPPLLLGFSFILVIVFPVIILFVLPSKAHGSRRLGYRDRRIS